LVKYGLMTTCVECWNWNVVYSLQGSSTPEQRWEPCECWENGIPADYGCQTNMRRQILGECGGACRHWRGVHLGWDW
jgi:hypothetical protein